MSLPLTAKAAGEPIEYLFIDYGRHVGYNYLYLPFTPKENVSLNLGIRYGDAFMTNIINGHTNEYTFKTVAWDYKIGYDVLKSFSVYFGHKSEHLLDEKNKFYNRNELGVRIHIIR